MILARIASRRTYIAEGAPNGTRKLQIAERLLQDDRVRFGGEDRCRIAADKYVRNKSIAQYLIDRRQSAAAGQAGIDDHQVRFTSNGGCDRPFLGRLYRADNMTHFCEKVRDQHPDECVVLHHENTQCPEWRALI